MDDEKIFIGALSKKTRVSVKTIRYYEEFGILEDPERTLSGYRVYSEKDTEKLLFVKKAKDLGLKLSEIKSIINFSEEGLDSCCSYVRNVFKNKIREYEEKIEELDRTKKKLEEKLKKWVAPGKAKNMKYNICPQIGNKGLRRDKRDKAQVN